MRGERMTADLTVYSVCVGTKYPDGYVLALQESVLDNLTISHDFRCITTRKIPGVSCVTPPVPYQGWWSKLGLFAPWLGKRPALYFDLDIAITKNIDYLADFTQYRFAAPANWAKSGHGGIQSSVMAWNGEFTEPYERIKGEWPSSRLENDGYRTINGKKFWGDQEYLWDILGDDWIRIPGVGSYKYHIQNNDIIPDWMSICVFHGDPKPPEVNDSCILPFTRTLRSLIK